MGDRVSIQFVSGDDKSVVLFSHWGGMEFVEKASEYLQELIEELDGKSGEPLGRLEPSTVMVDFVRHITKGMKRVTHDLYLGVSEGDGDNSDNGHHIIDLVKEKK